MPQFVDTVTAAALCVRFPHVPLTEVAERHGSGKITLNKGGASGSRVWQCPWFLHPAFCDFLLGNVAPNPYFGAPRLRRPDVFSPCYPWLYCQEASVEGEDLLGVDGDLRAFYRRAVVTAKYMPMEMNNSIHINSQMLTIPNTQFVFIGQNPRNLAGYQQIFTVEITNGPVTGGTFQLGFADSATAAFSSQVGGGGATAAPPPPETGVVYTSELPYNASAAEILTAVRAALGFNVNLLGFSYPSNPEAVTVVGPEGKPGAAGPWTLTLNIPDVKTCYAKYFLNSYPNGLSVKKSGHTRGIDAKMPAGEPVQVLGFSVPTGTQSIDDWWVGGGNGAVVPGHPDLYSLEWSGRYKSGSFVFLVTFEDGKVNSSDPVDVASAEPIDVKKCLLGALDNYKSSVNRAANVRAADVSALWTVYYGYERGSANYNARLAKEQQTTAATPGRQAPVGGNHILDLSRICPVYLSQPHLNAVPLEPFRYDNTDNDRPVYGRPLSKMATNKGDHPLVMYFGFHTLKDGYKVSNVEIAWVGGEAALDEVTPAPAVTVKKLDPYLANRLDQNVAKIIPMGEFTFQRHQVLGADMIYLLSVVGSVNMFTFLGFPPWTLLLSGIEAKQTRLPNGTPAFDMTFKFAFNPYTHQAIFRPLYMRWEFVRGVLIHRIPTNLMVPTEPLDPATGGRAKMNPKAVAQAYARPKAKRIIPLCINPYGTVVTQGAGSVVGNLPSSPPPSDPPNWGPTPPSFTPDNALAAPNEGSAGTPTELLGTSGGASGNSNPNPQTSTPQSSGGGEIQVPFGTVPAEKNEANLIALLQSLGTNLSPDSNVPDDDPVGGWVNKSNTLGGMISRSIAASTGSADEDVAAYNTGVAADIELGKSASSPWGASASPSATLSMAGENATGNLVNDIAYARAAHACGARLCPATRELIGLPREAPPSGSETLGAGPVPPTQPGNTSPSGSVLGAFINIAVNYAVNLGAANSVRSMATRVFDLGLIYPICDFTPILFLQ